MIPLRDYNRSRSVPFITYSLIAVNVLVFLYQLSLPGGGEEVIADWGLKPAFVTRYVHGEKVGVMELQTVVPDRSGREVVVTKQVTVGLTFVTALLPFLTSMFIHGGFAHILGNMWFLYIFGDNVEDHLGHGRYIFFYLGAGIAASIIHTLMSLDSAIPTVGASGAISGVLGAYAVTFPHARVLTLVPIFVFLQLVEIPAVLFLFIWFGLQLVSSLVSTPGEGGVAFWAHVGGFVAGLVAVKLLRFGSPPRASPYGRARDVPFEFNR
jgi:rhomboid family protein